MNAESLFREGLTVISTVGAPVLGALLGTGVVVGVLQSATQVQEPAVGALPRIITVAGVLAAGGPWMVQRLAAFLKLVLEELATRQ